MQQHLLLHIPAAAADASGMERADRRAACGGKTPDRPSLDEIIDTVIEHATKLTEVKGEYIAVREMRRHIGYYTAGLKKSAAMRRDVNLIEDYDSLLKFLDNIRSNRYTSSGR